MNKDPRPICNTCQVHLTTQHVILECPVYKNIGSAFNTINTEQHGRSSQRGE